MRPRVVLDTNVFVVSLSERSPYYWIFEALIADRFEAVVSTPIVLEYEEVIGRLMGQAAVRDALGVLHNSMSVIHTAPTFHWHLIAADPDDDKFVDAALAGRADGIVTYDRHFDALSSVDFPRVPVLTPDDLSHLLPA